MSTPAYQHFKPYLDGDVVVVEMTSREIRGPEAAQEVGQEIAAFIDQSGAKRFVLNFAKVQFLSSTAFAMLLNLWKKVDAQGGKLKVCNLIPEVRLGADILQVGRVIQIHEDEETAVASFGGDDFPQFLF